VPKPGHYRIFAALVAVAAVLATVLSTGCQSDHPDAIYQNYLTRLGRTLEVPVSLPSIAAIGRPPRPGQLKLELAVSRLDALDFLAVSGCAVQVTIGKRNSSLGRMARDSQRLLLNLEFLQLAPECIAYQRERGNSEAADTLEQAWQLKQQQLPALIFNATLASAEYRSFWRSPEARTSRPTAGGSEVITALEAINNHARRWLAGDYPADNRAFEILLSTVAGGDGGALLKALARQDGWLAAADTLVQQRLAKGPLCAPGLRPAAADILPNVIRKYFIGEIQPQSAILGRRYHELLPEVSELEDLLHSALPQLYRDWQRARDTRLEDYYEAPLRHVEQLKALQDPCTK
jgi:hypothetical protein